MYCEIYDKHRNIKFPPQEIIHVIPRFLPTHEEQNLWLTWKLVVPMYGYSERESLKWLKLAGNRASWCGVCCVYMCSCSVNKTWLMAMLQVNSMPIPTISAHTLSAINCELSSIQAEPPTSTSQTLKLVFSVVISYCAVCHCCQFGKYCGKFAWNWVNMEIYNHMHTCMQPCMHACIHSCACTI